MAVDIYRDSTEYRLPGFPRESDQGGRGTCAAFGMAAMLEYHLGFTRRLSPQYLYARCHGEGEGDRPGAEIGRVFEAAREYGVCEYSEWPYNRVPSGAEAQIRPEELEKIPTIRFGGLGFERLKTEPPTGVDEYKSVLCGSERRLPSPVLCGCRMYPSSLREPGWLLRPSGGEREEGLHAVVIYGWRDTPGQASRGGSRGYFLAQNSWKGENEIKIEYECIEQCAVSAGGLVAEPPRGGGGVPAAAQGPAAAMPAGRVSPVPVAQAAQGAAPMPAASLPAGAAPASAPAGAALMPAAPLVAAPMPDAALAVKSDFFGSQENNMRCEGGYSFPGIHLPFPQRLGVFCRVDAEGSFGGEENVRADASGGFAKFLAGKGAAGLLGEVKIYRIRIRRGSYYRLVSAFLHREGGVAQGDLDLLRAYVEKVYAPGARGRPVHCFFVVGTYRKFRESCVPAASPTLFLCERNSRGVWCFRLPKAECGPAAAEFFRHILPGSPSDLENRMERLIAGWDDAAGSITVDSLMRGLGIPERGVYRETIEHVLNRLFKKGGYARDGEGRIFPVRARGAVPAGFRECGRYADSPRRRFVSLCFRCGAAPVIAVASVCAAGVLAEAFPRWAAWWFSAGAAALGLLALSRGARALRRFTV